MPPIPEKEASGRGAARRDRRHPQHDALADALALPERDFVARLWRRLDAVLVQGTTGLAMTSGYGLDVDEELHLLRAIQAMTEVGPLTVASAFRPALASRNANLKDPGAYVDALNHELLPHVSDEELAGVFAFAADQTMLTIEQGWRVLRGRPVHGPSSARLDLDAASHPGILELADEMVSAAVVLLDEPSDALLLQLADMTATAVLRSARPALPSGASAAPAA